MNTNKNFLGFFFCLNEIFLLQDFGDDLSHLLDETNRKKKTYQQNCTQHTAISRGAHIHADTITFTQTDSASR